MRFLLSLILLLNVFAPLRAIAQDINTFELPTNHKASEFLPINLLTGPNYSVADTVVNDGMFNKYFLRTDFGIIEANSTSKALQRIEEMDALGIVDQLNKSDPFKHAVKESSKQVIQGAEYLVKNPIGSAKSVVSGVTKMFRRAGNTLFAAEPADNQDGRAKAFIGFSATKRAFANELGIDPYTDNEILQEALDEASWVGFAGGMTTAVAFSAVPGAAGSAADVTRSTATGVNAAFSKTPLDLEKQNREALLSMGIDEQVVELFLRNSIFPPSIETQITDALAKLDGVENRQAALEVATLTSERDVAEYLREQLELYAGYHSLIGPLKTIHVGPNDSVIAAETRKDEIVVIMPIDYLAWTQEIGLAFIAQDQNPGLQGRNKSLWITGKFSPRTEVALKELGWNIAAEAKKSLLPTSAAK